MSSWAEKRRKRRWNHRSTGQKRRRARENPQREAKRRDRLAYKVWLRANAEEILADARKQVVI